MLEVILCFQDVDDLDAGLFGSSFSKKQEKLYSTKTTVKSALKVCVISSCPCSRTYNVVSSKPVMI